MTFALQAGYYCSVCDCILRDSQSYLDHMCAVARALTHVQHIRELSILVTTAHDSSKANAKHLSCRCSNGKYHNRALGMNMVVERSTADQVCTPGSVSAMHYRLIAMKKQHL